MTTQLRPTLGQVAPCLSKPYQTEPSGQFGTRQCQLSRCSTGPSRVSKEEVYRQKEFKTAFAVPTEYISYAQQMTCGHWGIFISVGVLPQSLPPSSLCAANTGTCALAMVQFPWVSKSKESTIKKINTGIRCHLVSRPANTPKGWSLSPQCTNPTNHLLRFAGIGRQDNAFFCTDPVCGICFTWLPAARRPPPSICDCREIAFYFWGRETQTTMQNLTVSWNAWQSGIALTHGVRIGNLQ